MRTRATIVALVVVVSILLFVFGESTTQRNPIEVESRTDELIAPAASPRPVPDKKVSANRMPPDPDAILGLMMMVLGARDRR